MADGYGGDDDTESFEFYEVNTKGHGPALLIGTFLFSVALYALLPFMVRCDKRREEALKAKRVIRDYTDDDDDHDLHHDDEVSVQLGGDEVEISFSQIQLQIPPPPDSVRGYNQRHLNPHHRSASNIPSDAGWDLRSMSSAAQASVWSSPTKFVHTVLANTHHTGRHGLHANRMQRRHVELQADDPESKEFRALVQRIAKRRGVSGNYSDDGHGGGGRAAGGHHGSGARTVASYSPETSGNLQQGAPRPPRSASPALTFSPGMRHYESSSSSSSNIYPIPRRAGGAALAVSDLGSDIGSDVGYLEHSTHQLDPYNTSGHHNKYPKSASSTSITSDPQARQEQEQQHSPADEEKAFKSGKKGTKDHHKKSAAHDKNIENVDEDGWWDSLLQVVEWDHENKRLFKLAIPYTSQALVAGIAEAARVAVIGKFYGTRELAAYVIAHMFLGLTQEFFGGIIDAMGVLCIQSIGMGTTRLTGQYIQIGLILYLAIVTPATMAFVIAMDDILAFFGFDEETVRIGVEFTQVYSWYLVLYGFDNSLNALLDITGHEIYSTIATSAREIFVTVAVLVAALVADPSLRDAAGIMLGILILVIFWNVGYIAGRGWWKKYYSGMVYTFALRNWEATKSVMKTSIPLSLGYLLAYGEWELLTVFAAFLGPAEVATWGLLGTVWDVLEETTEAISEAGEVRCAYLLGAGRSNEARVSAFKSMFLAFFASTLLSSIVLMCGESLAVWMTDDPTLQGFMADLIPLFALGNVGLTTGTTAWTLVGAQGRYSLSTAVGFAGSWCITVPLSALSSVALHFDLRGQTAAVVVGYMFSGIWNLFFLLRSDWKAISDKVIAYNAANDIELDSDQVSRSEAEEESSRNQPNVTKG